MNDRSHPPVENYDDFPEVGEPSQSDENQSKKTDRKGFQNPLYPNDSVTTCSGFLNEIRSHEKDGDTLYFVRVGLIQGSRRNGSGDWEGDITNCDLLVGSTLKKWARAMKPLKEPYAGIRMTFTIRNLKFSLGEYDDKPVINSRGVLETITFGHLDT